MAKEAIGFDEFLGAVEPPYRDFVSGLHRYLLDSGCKAKIEVKSNGYLVSYSHLVGKSRRSIANFLFRKKGMMVRIYGENAGKYQEFLEKLPQEMIEAIQKAGVCKKLIDPGACNPKCGLGYDFMIGDEHFAKCGYGCFMFFVNDGNNGYIRGFVENEMRFRGDL